MSNITLKNIPDPLYRRLKKSAKLHRRSVNSEAIVCLEKVLSSRRKRPEVFLEEAKALRESLGDVFVTDKDLSRAKREGRP